MADFASHLHHESWALYGVGMAVIVLRMYARYRRVGIKGYSPDDWLMVACAILYTTLVYCLNRIVSGGGSNLYPPEQYAEFTQEEIDDRIMGSKIVVVSEQAMLTLIYLLKGCMLCMYFRLTQGTRYRRAIIALCIYVAIGYVATEIGFFTYCRPFKGYWAVPPPDPQCTTLQNYAITQACFNLSGDVAMLLIAVPMVARLNLPVRQRIVLSLVFGMGIFVIIAAILTKVFNLSDLYSSVYMLWYLRESSVAVYVTNVPMIWPLLRELFPFLRTALTSGHSNPNSRSKSAMNRRGSAQILSNKSNTREHAFELGIVDKEMGAGGSDTMTDRTSDEQSSPGGHRAGGRSELRFGGGGSRRNGSPASDERVLNTKASQPFWGKGDIHTETTIAIERESADLEAGEGRGCGVMVPTRHVRIEGGERSHF